ncbi:MAG: hypothetical protein U1E86_22990 [Burkholderiaceae bacterium]
MASRCNSFSGSVRYDLVCVLDVLEHCADDRASLASLLPLLARGGRVLVTVPAYDWLFGAHDLAHRHFRRYTYGRLRRVARDAGFDVECGGYFNALLFPLMALYRLLASLGMVRDDADVRMPSRALNGLFAWVFSLERGIVPRVKFPFGGSVIAVLRAPS